MDADDAGRARARVAASSTPIPRCASSSTPATGRAFQTGLDVVQLAREPEALREQSRRTKRAELKLTAWHNGVSKPVIAAVNGVCAGGGLHFVADADIVIAVVQRELPRSARVGRSGERVRDDRAGPQDGVRAGHADGAGRAARAALGAARVRARHDLASRRSAGASCASRRRRSPRSIADHEPAELARRKRALWDALELGLTASYRNAVNREDGRRMSDGYGTYETLKLERQGSVGWLINNRPQQLNAMNALMRDEFAERLDRARPRPGGAGHRAHR